MKSVAVVLLFAFVAQTYASPEIDEFLMQSADDSDRHPYVQCKIDLFNCFKKGAVSKTECMKTYYTCMKQLVPTVPSWVIQCNDELKTCVANAPGFLAKGKCFLTFAKCLKNGGPTSPPTFRDDEEPGVVPSRHPYIQCKIDLYDCIRLNKTTKMQCMTNYKDCMAVLIPTVPPYVIACKDVLNTCVSSSSGLLEKAKCFTDFGYCLINKGPSPPPSLDAGEYILNALEDQGPVPTRHLYFQCKIDMYKCIKDGQKGKLECAKDYKTCMAQLIPTLPPYVAQCRDELKVCYKDAQDWKAKWQCGKDLFKCLKNKGSS